MNVYEIQSTDCVASLSEHAVSSEYKYRVSNKRKCAGRLQQVWRANSLVHREGMSMVCKSVLIAGGLKTLPRLGL